MIENQNISKAKDLVAQLKNHGVSSMPNRQYSNLSKLPYKVMAFVNAMSWRIKECAEAAIFLIEKNLTHPSLMLIRSAMENAAITICLTDIIQKAVQRGEVVDEVDNALMQLLFGNNYRKDDPFINLEDARFKAQRFMEYAP